MSESTPHLGSEFSLCLCLCLCLLQAWSNRPKPTQHPQFVKWLTLIWEANEDDNINVGRQEKIFLPKSSSFIKHILLWLPCMFLFSLKFLWLLRQRLLLNETMDVLYLLSLEMSPCLKDSVKMEQLTEVWRQKMSALCALFVFCNLPTLPLPSSAVLLKVPIAMSSVRWKRAVLSRSSFKKCLNCLNKSSALPEYKSGTCEPLGI